MDKLNGKSVDIVSENIERLKELFPNVVSEGKVDFDMLSTILGAEIDTSKEKYQFMWNGKMNSIRIAQSPSTATLRPCKEKSKDWDKTGNLYIEGDNLEALKLLQKTYYGCIKLIYIDPPYNTGNDFVYNDNFNDSIGNYIEQTNQNDSSNPETSGRYHSNWLNMMYPRLSLSRGLLSKDGAIFISIDDHECDNLRKICDEIFGANCFVGDISYQRTYAPRNDSKGISCEVEHILVYGKSAGWVPKKLPRTAEMNKLYKNPDGDDVLWRPDNPCGPGAASHQGMVYAIQHPFTGEYLYPSAGAHWRYQQSDMLRIMSGWGNYGLKDLHDDAKRAEVCGVAESDIRKDVKGIVLLDDLDAAKAFAQKVYDNGKWPVYYFTSGGTGGIAKKTYLDENNGKVVTNLWPCSDVGHSDEAKKELMSLFDGKAPFDTPKPTRLIQRILAISTNENDIVLDYFSGSATTAHAVFKSNVESEKHNRFILVQLPEKASMDEYATLCDIGEERIRRAGDAIKKEWEDKNSSLPLVSSNESFKGDIGFKVFKLDSTNINPWDNTNEYDENTIYNSATVFKLDRSKEDILYEIMLKYGVFDQSVSEVNVNGKKLYRVGQRHMIVCLEDDVDSNDIAEICKMGPRVVVFKEAGFKDDNAKINAEYNLKKAGVEDVKCI